ncbi:MAG: methyltransferase domain-containing protein [Proteobacteria bacterium]|nr:methyltransferase domain-containing protein [Pseudomonadota bacterium]
MEYNASANPALSPSEYTAALIQVLRERRAAIAGVSALEIGVGSGVVLAELGALGAASLCGVDIEESAIDACQTLLVAEGMDDRAILHLGDMWEPVGAHRFDLIVANLPHFPMPDGGYGIRRPSWSAGGPDGRRFLDRFIDGLAAQLSREGRALITHNAFVGLDATRDRLLPFGLEARSALSRQVFIPPEKIALMPDAIWRREEGRTLFHLGPYAFGEMVVLEIAWDGTFAAEGDNG